MAHEYVEARLMEAGLDYRHWQSVDVSGLSTPQLGIFGAHDISVNMDISNESGVFNLWSSFTGLDASWELADDLSNLSDIADEMIRRLEDAGYLER